MRRPAAELGSLRADLEHWASDFLEEMSSPPGRSYIRDALGGDRDGGKSGSASPMRSSRWRPSWAAPLSAANM